MSFTELWNSNEGVREYWLENRKLTEEYLEMVKYRNETEKSLGRHLEKLLNFPFFKLARNSLVPTAEKLKNLYTVQLQQSKNFVNDSQNLVIHPIREILQSQDSKFREKTENCKRLDSEKKKLSKNLEHCKEKYWKSCKETLLATKNKGEHIAKEAQTLENYIKGVDSMNRFNLAYIDEMGKNLSVFQVLEAERFGVLHDCLRKMQETEEKYLKVIIPELESIPSAIETFNPASDIEEFISKTGKSEILNLVFIEHSPYGNTCTVPEQKISEAEQVLQKIIIKCWEGLPVTQEEEDNYRILIADKENRKSWLYFMNERRIKSQFAISGVGFEMMKMFLSYFLDFVNAEMDENCAKMAIVMSQTFFTEKNGEKVYLHTNLSTHKIWKNPAIWTLMIEDGIQKELQNYVKFCTDDTSEEHKEHMSSLMVSQISSYIHIMRTFFIEPDFIKSISDSLASKYKMPDLDLSEYLSFNTN